jgi:hypothetical protein
LRSSEIILIAAMVALVVGIILSIYFNSLFIFLFLPFGFGWGFSRSSERKREAGSNPEGKERD